LSEVVYKMIARHRQLASFGTRVLWGNDVRRPTYGATRQIFLRSLGVIFLIAFVSLWSQIDGLMGSNGISPVAQFLPMARARVGSGVEWLLPTLCWLNASDGFLHLLCGTGVLFSLLIITGLIPAIALLGAYVCYLSLTIAGQPFLNFQWDILLLETGFLAIFFAPWRWRLTNDEPVPPVALFLLKLLLFKLMFMSGVVKLTSGDSSWADLTAMNYHFETQPLPTVLGWWAFQAPEWFKRATTAFTLVAELVAPFLIWTPRRFRVIGCAIIVALQIGIGLTGNYAFFNLLTAVLSLLLIDDQIWPAFVRRLRERPCVSRRIPTIQSWASIAVLVLTLPLTAFHIFQSFRPEADWPSPISAIYQRVEPFRIANGYGLFRVMTKTRPEIVVEGSADGVDWLPYTFKWKPGDLDRAPRWVQPHQPRLDWQMWFAALGSTRSNPWFYGLAQGLLVNSPPVLRLLESNPFGDKPPRFLRAILFEYRFTSVAEHRATGAWWKRDEKREYMRPISLRDE
ncbi:MAG: lipase maturation factor family protein, partial [Verrucomicrobiota bacterium]|nr:lipase maturation factor family protein [Verrucomicrobiota bacterium]